MAANKYLKGVSPFSGIGGALANVGMGGFINSKVNNESLMTGIMKDIPMSLLIGIAPQVYWTNFALSTAVGVGKAVAGAEKPLKDKYNKLRKPSTNFTYTDTQQASTMRQAAVQAIQGSKMNARNALGGEASLMHRGYGDRRM